MLSAVKFVAVGMVPPLLCDTLMSSHAPELLTVTELVVIVLLPLFAEVVPVLSIGLEVLIPLNDWRANEM